MIGTEPRTLHRRLALGARLWRTNPATSGQDQPKDKDRAQRTSGPKEQKDAAQQQAESPGQPAGGE